MYSVIVIARDQASEVKSCLDAILDGADFDELEIVVVCNGCSDETAQIARAVGTPVRVVTTANTTVAAAMNAGDRVARAFPRFYIQAGAICRLSSIRRMLKCLSDGAAVAVAPPIRLRLDKNGLLVRPFYDIAARMPSHLDGLRGSGVLGLSEAAKKRIPEFPNVVAIEEFVRLNFKPDEYVRLEDTRSWVTPAGDFRGLVAAQVERIRGIRQLRALEPPLPIDNGKSDRRALRRLCFRRIDLWFELAVYLFVQTIAHLLAAFSAKTIAGAGDEVSGPMLEAPEANLGEQLQDPQSS